MPPEFLSIAIRFALYANLMALFGLPMLALYTAATASRTLALPNRTLAVLAISALLLSAASIVIMSASMSGVSILDVTRSSITAMIFETPMGAAWRVRVGAISAAFLIAAKGPARHSAAHLALVLVSGAGLASLAWTGHGAAGEGTAGSFQLVADVVHLLAAGAWFGALLALGAALARISTRSTLEDIGTMQSALQRFAVAGSIIVGLLIVTGLVNGWALVGPAHVIGLAETPYGRLLVFKLALFAAMLVLAATNRFLLTPTLARATDLGHFSPVVVVKLRWSIAIETILAVSILATVAWLGTHAPPMAA